MRSRKLTEVAKRVTNARHILYTDVHFTTVICHEKASHDDVSAVNLSLREIQFLISPINYSRGIGSPYTSQKQCRNFNSGLPGTQSSGLLTLPGRIRSFQLYHGR